MIRIVRSLVLILAGTASVCGASLAQDIDDIEAKRPIIAQLLSDPAGYLGQPVIIYGLVVESISDSVFLLQDVSQRPLKIIVGPGLKAAVGDQIIVSGALAGDAAELVFFANALVSTRVLGGGGCC